MGAVEIAIISTKESLWTKKVTKPLTITYFDKIERLNCIEEIGKV